MVQEGVPSEGCSASLSGSKLWVVKTSLVFEALTIQDIVLEKGLQLDPTIENAGKPGVTAHCTSTERALTPSNALSGRIKTMPEIATSIPHLTDIPQVERPPAHLAAVLRSY